MSIRSNPSVANQHLNNARRKPKPAADPPRNVIRGLKPASDKPRLYHRCRNPRCQHPLKPPVESRLDAFCKQSCYDGYFETRCVVCCEKFSKPRRNDLQKVCHKKECKNAYRYNSAAYLSPKYTKRLKDHFAELAKDCLFQRDTPPANLVGGYKFPGAPTVTDLGLKPPLDRHVGRPGESEVISPDGVPCFVRVATMPGGGPPDDGGGEFLRRTA